MYSFAVAQHMKSMDMSNQETKSQPQATTYTCVMHREIHATKPGNCPICGMKLVKEKPKQQKGAGKKNIEIKMPDGKAYNIEDTSKMAMGKLIMEDTAKGIKIDMGGMPMDNIGNMPMPN